MRTDFKKLLMTGTAVLAIGALSAGDALAANDLIANNGGDWGGIANETASTDGAAADHYKAGGTNPLVIDAGEYVGAAGATAVTGLSMDASGNAAIIVFDGGADDATATDAIVITGTIDPSAGGTGDEFTMNIGEASATGQGANVTFWGAVGANNVANVRGDADTKSVITFGNDTNAMDFAADLDVGADAGLTEVTLNLKTNSTISGAISDTQASKVTINVDGNATISGATDLATSAAASDVAVAVDDGVVFTVDNAFNIGADTITLGSTTSGSNGELKLNNSSSAITGNIQGFAEGKGTLNVDEDATVTGNIGSNNKLAAIDVVADKTLSVVSVAGGITIDATTITLNDGGDNDGITLDTSGSNTAIVVKSDIDTSSTGNGMIKVANAGQITLEGDVGADADNDLGVLTWTANEQTKVDAKKNLWVEAIKIDGLAGELKLSGTAAQTVSGTIESLTTEEGIIEVINTSTEGVTFKGAVGIANSNELDNLKVGSASVASKATFEGAVGLENMAVLATAGDTTVTFQDTLTLDNTTSTIDGGDAEGEDATVNFAGNLIGDTVITDGIELDDNSGSAIVNINGTAKQTISAFISGEGDGEGTLNITNTHADGVEIEANVGNNHDLKLINIAANVAVDVGDSGTVDIANFDATTIQLNSGSVLKLADTNGNMTVVGNIEGGSGKLDVDESATVTGNIGKATALDSIEIAASAVLNVTAAAASDATVQATTIQLDGASSGLTLTPVATKALTVANNITAKTANEGDVTFADVNGSTITVESIGTAAAPVDQVDFAAGANAQTVVVKGSLYTDITAPTDSTIDADDTIRFTGTGVTASAKFEGQSAGEGIIEIGDGSSAASVTFGNVALGGGTELERFNVQNGSTANISHSITTKAATAENGLVVGTGSTLNISAADNDVTLSDTQGDIDFNGTVNITGDNNVTIDGNSGTSDTSIDGTLSTVLGGTSKTLTIGGQNSAKIGTNADTTITAGNRIILNDATTIGASGRTTTLNLRRTTDFDPSGNTPVVIDATGAAADVTLAGTLKIGLDGESASFDTGDEVTLIDDDTGSSDFAALITSGDIEFVNTGLVTIEDNSSTATDLKVKIGFRDAVSTLGGSGGGAAASLLAISSTDATGELATIRSRLLTASTEEAAEIAESIAPTVDGGSAAAGVSVSTQSSNVTSSRLASLRQGDAVTGMAAGNVTYGLRAWTQAFGSTGEQDRRDGIDGYEVDTYGIAVGVDTETLADDWVWGLAFSYADSEVDSDNANKTNTEIDSYQFSVYAEYAYNDRTYFAGQLGYALSENDSKRNNVGGTAGLTASSEYDADQFMARFEAGRSYVVGNETNLTPKALVNFMHYDADNYTETGAGNANLRVDSEELNIFEVGVGVDASWVYQQADGSYLRPAVELGVRHDFVGDEVETTSRFTGSGAAFNSKGFDPAQTTFNAGLGLTYFSTMNWELSAEYDFEYKSDYDAHSGVLKAAYKF